MKIFIKDNTDYFFPVLYVLRVIERNKNTCFTITKNADNADLYFDHTNPASQPLDVYFYKSLRGPDTDFSHLKFFQKEQLIKTETGATDYIATIFYMINCLQERNPQAADLDSFGRYKYSSSFQKKFGSIENNLVQNYINTIVSSWNIKSNNFKSAFFLSHDIDNIYGSFIQDGFWALKKGRIDIVLRIIANEFIGKPHWRNIDKIINLHSEYDIRSTFFWLVNKGKGEMNIKNADYEISKEKTLLNMVSQYGSVNGLHKSCSAMSIEEEIGRHPEKPVFNRYHFLKFQTHSDWQKLNDAGITFDSSLGYAEITGFRNSFGMPFQPYNFNNNEPYNFVEAPMNFMDGTFNKYMNIPVNKIAASIIDFYEKNNENCIFSVCWHNSYFTGYKFSGYIDQYKKILSYIYENKTECLTPEEIIKKVKIS